MPSRRNTTRRGALSVTVGIVLVATAAQFPAEGRAPRPTAAPDRPAILRVDPCGPAGGLCGAPRYTVLLPAGAVTTVSPLTFEETATGPVEIALGTPGRMTDVTVVDERGRRVPGHSAEDRTRWTSENALPAGGRFTVRLAVEGLGPDRRRRQAARLEFRTHRAPAGERLVATFGPDSDRTYGVGQPLTAELNLPVPADRPEARRVVERALEVRAEPQVEGSWYWVGPTTLHYRPRGYWPAHATVRVRSGLDGVRVTDGLYGGPSNPLTLTTGDRVEAVTDVAALRMTVRRNGEILRTIPVTTGKAGYRTRGGIKVVLGKEPMVRMRGDSIGIARGSEDFYDLKVRWATRVTWSGEYLHAAPWSTDAQGVENVSHGCTGMSTEDAAWLFRTVREGDLVQVVNGYGEPMSPFDNGFGDWNLSWTDWRHGSALGPRPATHPRPAGSLNPAL